MNHFKFNEMKQVTKKEAIAIAESKVWKKWSDDEVVRFQLFQNRLCLPFSRFHEAVEKVLNRPVYTHEFGTEGVIGLKKEYLGVKKAPTFEKIIDLIPEEKRLIIKI